jgi:CBS domain-containing protein
MVEHREGDSSSGDSTPVDQPTPAGRVRSVGANGASSEQIWVRCEHQDDTVEMMQCEICPRCTAIRYDQNGVAQAVHCREEVGGQGLGGRYRDNANVQLKRLSVGDVMTRDVLCLQPDVSLDAATAMFVERGFKAAPIVDAEGTLLGMLSESDVLLDTYVQDDSVADQDDADSGMQVLPEPRTVDEVMQPLACAVLENIQASQAAGVMAYEGVHRLVVVNGEGHVVGLVSATDLLAWIARSDGYVFPDVRKLTV